MIFWGSYEVPSLSTRARARSSTVVSNLMCICVCLELFYDSSSENMCLLFVTWDANPSQFVVEL